MMIQFSVYVRTVRNAEDADKYCRRIRTFLPPEGSVRILRVTDKQYNTIEIAVGRKWASEDLLDSKEIIEL